MNVEWIVRVLEVLEQKGVHGIRIERFALDLEVPTFGFYWHFKNRSHLLSEIIEFWKKEFTCVITENIKLAKADAERRLLEIMVTIMDHDLAKYDLVIRVWAAHDETARPPLPSTGQSEGDVAITNLPLSLCSGISETPCPDRTQTQHFGY